MLDKYKSDQRSVILNEQHIYCNKLGKHIMKTIVNTKKHRNNIDILKLRNGKTSKALRVVQKPQSSVVCEIRRSIAVISQAVQKHS